MKDTEEYPGGDHPYLRALDDSCHRGVPPTDDFGAPLGKGGLSATAESNMAVPVGHKPC
jgi:hypothetical protein